MPIDGGYVNCDISYFVNTVCIFLSYSLIQNFHNDCYRIAGFCREDFNVASHRIRNIKIRDIFDLVTILSREIL